MSEEKDQKNELHIGKKLKEARQSKGMTLDDLQQATKIQKRYLIAIEDEKFDELPGDFYVRAFVKQYANTVGLNGSDLLKDYDEQLPETKTATYSDHLDEAVETRRGRQHQVTADRIDQLRHYLPTIIVVLVVVVILGGIWLTAIVRNHQNASTKIDSSSVKVSGESSHKAKKTAKKTRKKSHKSNLKLTESSRTANAVVYRSNSLKASTNRWVLIASQQLSWLRAPSQLPFVSATLVKLKSSWVTRQLTSHKTNVIRIRGPLRLRLALNQAVRHRLVPLVVKTGQLHQPILLLLVAAQELQRLITTPLLLIEQPIRKLQLVRLKRRIAVKATLTMPLLAILVVNKI